MVSSRGEPVIDPKRGISLTPLHLGTRTTEALGIAEPALSRATLEALGSMIGIAIERAPEPWKNFRRPKRRIRERKPARRAAGSRDARTAHAAHRYQGRGHRPALRLQP